MAMVSCHLLSAGVCHSDYQPESWFAHQQFQHGIAALSSLGSDLSLPESQSDFSTLLQAVLPQFRIDPGNVPVFFQEQVRKRLQDFSSLYQEELQAMFQRARPHLPMIKLILKQHNVPGYYAFVPLVESAFQRLAEHPVSRARGWWQLLPDTARYYGIQVSQRYDERVHPARSTEAAARYLRVLLNMFGDDAPLLVLAAYNFGEQNLTRAMLRVRSRDIWTLFRRREIPYQTRDYLVKMVTFWVLIARAEGLQPALEPGELSRAAVRPRSTAPAVATPACFPRSRPTFPPQSLYTPAMFVQPLAACCTPPPPEHSCWHTVETGESLWTIAQRYALDVSTIKALNQLGGARSIIHPGQRLATCLLALPEFMTGPDL